MTCLSAEADMGESTLNFRRHIDSWDDASSIEVLWCNQRLLSISISRMSADNSESLLKIGGNMGLALRGVSMAIDINEGEMNNETNGRYVSSLDQSNDMRLGRRGPPEE